MESVLEQHGILPSVTFRQLHRITQLSLSIFATCVDTNELVSFHHTKTPDVKVIDAVLASCCIPLIFPIYTIETKRYIDGGMISDWSIDTDVMDVSREKTLLIRGTYETATEFKPIRSFMDYIHYLLHQGSQNIERLSSQMRDVCESLTFRITIPFGTHSFSLSHLHEDPEKIQKECNEILNRYANL
jgi:predicted patatin/cPLA2 family phospholipase